jgi:uracil-DNA glycosylase family 4
MPEFVKWVNRHRYDGGGLSPDQKALREFYSRLINLIGEPAFRDGKFFPLNPANHGNPHFGRLPGESASGHWLYEALHRHGFASRPDSISRDDGLVLTDCYVSAAARCAPPANKPSRAELERCRPYLVAELRLLRRVRVVVTLGRIAHESWLKAAGWWQQLPPRSRPPFAHGAATSLPDGTVVIASYHPSRQNTNTGRLTRAMWYSVFRHAKGLLQPA